MEFGYQKAQIMNCNEIRRLRTLVALMAALLLFSTGLWAQEGHAVNLSEETLISAARDMATAARFGTLITLDKSGHPQARTMDTFAPEESMEIWFGSNPKSRKVEEIRQDPRVTIHFAAPKGDGYVVLKGRAYIIDDRDLKKKYWKEGWEEFYPDREASFTLIRVVPDRLEIVDYSHGIVAESDTWAVPSVDFDSKLPE